MTTLAKQTWVQTQRLLIRWTHDQQSVIQALVLPCMFLIAINLVFGKAISGATGHSALYGSVPMAALVGAIFGSTAGGVLLMGERDNGLLSRFWVLPVYRLSGLLSRLAAEVLRILVTTLLVLCTGYVLGFRFHQGVGAAVAWIGVPVLFGIGFWVLVTTMALYVANTVLAETTGIGVAMMFFFCTGYVPLDQYPEWIQPVVEHQPMSYAIAVMQGLSRGGPVLSPLLGTLGWMAATVVVCAPALLYGYRKASMR